MEVLLRYQKTNVTKQPKMGKLRTLQMAVQHDTQMSNFLDYSSITRHTYYVIMQLFKHYIPSVGVKSVTSGHLRPSGNAVHIM